MPSPLNVLLIEDSADDVLMLMHMVERSGLKINLQVIRDGEAAVAYLDSVAVAHPAFAAPHIVLLDLSLPKVSGLDILRRMKGHSRLKEIPVITLSGTENPQDIQGSQQLRAHEHFVKPMNLAQLLSVAKSLQTDVLKLAS